MMRHYGYTVISVKTLLGIKCVFFMAWGKWLITVMFDNYLSAGLMMYNIVYINALLPTKISLNIYTIWLSK